MVHYPLSFMGWTYFFPLKKGPRYKNDKKLLQASNSTAEHRFVDNFSPADMIANTDQQLFAPSPFSRKPHRIR